MNGQSGEMEIGSRSRKRWLFASAAGLAGALLLTLLTFGVPEGGGCGGPPEEALVDNGRAPTSPEVISARNAAKAAGAAVGVVDPSRLASPLASTMALRIRPIVPHGWVGGCNSDENLCSIGLRIDYCGASVLFVGDAELQEEAQLDPLGHATLLQLGHHGSDTSSGPAFLAKVTPKIPVVSPDPRAVSGGAPPRSRK